MGDQDRSVGFFKENQKGDAYSVYPGVFTRWMFGLWFSLTVHGLQIGTPLQKRVSCGVVLMASTMLHEKCCNTVLLQIGASDQKGDKRGWALGSSEFLWVFIACVLV